MKTTHPPQDKPLMVYDGDCGFCRYWLVKWQKISKQKYNFEAYQSAASNFPDIPEDNFKSAVQLILKDGTVYSGAAAAYYTYYDNGALPILFKLYRSWAIFRKVSNALYSWIAKNRNEVFKYTLWVFGKDPQKNSTPRVLFLIIALSLIIYSLAKILQQLLA